MRLLNLIQEFFWFTPVDNKEVNVRIIKRNKAGVIVAEKYVNIESIYNPTVGPVGININQKEIDSTQWKKL